MISVAMGNEMPVRGGALRHFGDARRAAIGSTLVERVVETGSLVIRKLGGTRAREIAIHRFLSAPSVTCGEMVETLAHRTAAVCKGRRIVAVQDTTEINFAGREERRRGLGPAGDGVSAGFFLHPVIAIDSETEAVLGLLDANIWTRSDEFDATPARERALEDKESMRWLEGAARAAERLTDAASVMVVALRAGTVEVCRPRHGGNPEGPKHLSLTMVEAREVDWNGEGTPLLWRLLTTIETIDAADAAEIVRLYRLRWRIEEIFRSLKSDGLRLEETQMQDAGRLFKLALIGLAAATRTVQRVDARDGSDRPATDVVDRGLLPAAEAISPTLEGKTPRRKNPHPPRSLAWLAWIIARLGGWNCHYKPPGPKTMRTGWARFAAMATGFIIADQSNA